MHEVILDAEMCAQMEASPENHPTTRWAVYVNVAMDSTGLGDLCCLAVGKDNTYDSPPASLPHSPNGPGWKYRFIGWANLGSGVVDPIEERDAQKEKLDD